MFSVPVPAKPELNEAEHVPLDALIPDDEEDAEIAKVLEGYRVGKSARFEELLQALRDEFLHLEKQGSPLPRLPHEPEDDSKRLLPGGIPTNDCIKHPLGCDLLPWSHDVPATACQDEDMHSPGASDAEDKAADNTLALDSTFEAEDIEEEDEYVVKSHHKPNDKVEILMDTIPAAVIVLNSIILGLSLDYNPDSLAWQVLEIAFVCFYTGEFVVKLKLFGLKWYFCAPSVMGWNCFDFLCLMLMYLDLGVTTYIYVTKAGIADGMTLSGLAIIKLFRLARLARLVRALRFKVFFELRVIVLGVFSGLRVLLWAFVLLVVIVYGLGVALRNMIGDEEEEFSSLPASMFTTFRCFTDGCAAYDGTPLSERLRESYGAAFMISYIFIITLVTMGFFNLIMAVFIDNVTSSQFIRKQAEISDTALSVSVHIKEKMLEFLSAEKGIKPWEDITFSRSISRKSIQLDEALVEWDQDVSRDTFEEWLNDDEFVRVLEDASIDMSCKGMLFDVLDADAGGELSTTELVTGLMRLRGPVTKLDVIGVSLKVSYLVTLLESLRSEESLKSSMQRQMSGLSRSPVRV
eukprot:TRINITY_DN8320_c0_g1_i1.p1 TRINITY_DN8320_c0_g1~~TRINITY_DN8320_c0_g1_i1.p1  ORF type:complete len:577 (-),score=124.52 TRINITY_DN8320_c0_g1_i1:99-1829(-)